MKSFKYTLYFGRNTGTQLYDGAGEVSMGSIKSFLKDVVSPMFPGFTYQDSVGYWKGEAERSFILTIITDTDKIDDIRMMANVYKLTWDQESVLIETSMVEAELY